MIAGGARASFRRSGSSGSEGPLTRPAAVLALLAILGTTPALSAEAPKHVLILQSLGRGFEPYDSIVTIFRSELALLLKSPVVFHEVSLDASHFAGAGAERPLVDYLATFDPSWDLELVVAVGGPAARFVQRHRDRLFPSTLLLVAGVDVRHLTQGGLADTDSVVASRFDLPGALAHILDLLPATKEIDVVLGTSPVERFWKEELQRAFEPFAKRARLVFLDDLPLEEILRRVAVPSDSVVALYGMYAIDAQGLPRTDDAALAALAAAARVPLFGLLDNQLGKGIVGGPLISLREVGRASANAAARLLADASAAPIRPPPIGPGVPTYDDRQLRRLRIDASRLPPGSVVLFAPPGFWETRGRIVLWSVLIGGAELGLIVVLLATLRGRRLAEKALHGSRERFALAVDGANDGLWDWDLRTGHVYYSERCRSMLGFEEHEVPSRFGFWDERIHSDDVARVKEELQAHLDGAAAAFRVEHRLRGRDGGYRWILARGKALRDAAGSAYRIAGSWTDVTELKHAEEGMRNVSQKLLVAQEEERARLARELHDDVTQRLARLAIDVGRIEHGDPEIGAETMARGVREELTRLSEDVHALSYRLHPSLLEDLGLGEALQVECERFTRLTRVPARLAVLGLAEPVPQGVAICLYRIAQEALRNIARHADARTVDLTLRGMDGGVQLAVRDDGIGFDASGESTRRSLGHASMRERVRLLQGELDIESSPGEGTTVVAWVPVTGPAA